MNEEIRYVMHYLYLKGYNAKSAMNEIHDIYHTEYPSYATAKRMFQQFGGEVETPSLIESQQSPKREKRIEVIKSIMDNDPTTSVRLIAEQTQIPKTTVWRTLVSDMGLKYQVPILIPHLLTSEMKEKRVEKCYELLRVLEDSQLNPSNIVTGDEAWLQWTGRIIGKWQTPDSPPPLTPRLNQTIKKTMIIAFFSFTKMLVAHYLPNGTINNSLYMCQHIWPAIAQEFKKRRPKNGAKGIFLHFDNSPIHKSKESLKIIDDLGFILLENPPYSPDIAPSDFWLFGFINEKRKGTVASDENELIFQTSQILSQIDSSVLGTVLKEWIRRLHMVIDLEGEYLPK